MGSEEESGIILKALTTNMWRKMYTINRYWLMYVITYTVRSLN